MQWLAQAHLAQLNNSINKQLLIVGDVGSCCSGHNASGWAETREAVTPVQPRTACPVQINEEKFVCCSAELEGGAVSIRAQWLQGESSVFLLQEHL